MGVRISLLKEAKKEILNLLGNNYPNYYFNVFYSTGQKHNNYNDQYLKIEISLSIENRKDLKDKIKNKLLSINEEFNNLEIRIKKYKNGKLL